MESSNKIFYGMCLLAMLLGTILLIGALQGCAPVSPLEEPPPKPGDKYTCTTDSGVEVHTYYGGPSCAETQGWLETWLVRYAQFVNQPCVLGDVSVEFVPQPITRAESGRCDPYCYGTYQPATQRMTVWHKTEGEFTTTTIVGHELAHHCLDQQTRFAKDEATDHCVMCGSGYLPCGCHEQADCLIKLFPEHKDQIEAIRAQECTSESTQD